MAVNHESGGISTLPTNEAARHDGDGPTRALMVDGRLVGYTSPNAATRRSGCPLWRLTIADLATNQMLRSRLSLVVSSPNARAAQGIPLSLVHTGPRKR